jgi:hypothetical protein
VAGAPDNDLLPDKPTRRERCKIFLADVKHRGPRDRRDIGAIVDRPRFFVPLRNLAQHRQQLELLGSLDGLVSELDDVYATGVSGLQKLGEVSLGLSGIRAEVELCIFNRHLNYDKRNLREPAPTPFGVVGLRGLNGASGTSRPCCHYNIT